MTQDTHDEAPRDEELDALRATGASDEIEANRLLSSDERIRSLVTSKRALHTQRLFNSSGSTKTLLRAKKTAWIHNLIYLDGKKFDFTGRRYLEQIYNPNYGHKLLKTGRQVEKCLDASHCVSLPNGSEVQISKLRPKDRVLGMDATGHQVVDTVVASESNGDKPCLAISTRLGAKLIVTENHPLLTPAGWCVASELKLDASIAQLRVVGLFGDHPYLSSCVEEFAKIARSGSLLPESVFSLDKVATSLFISKLSSTLRGSDYLFTSECFELADQVRRIARKLGIVTTLVSALEPGCGSVYGLRFAHINPRACGSGDVIWDEVISIEPTGTRPTWSIQTTTETFICDFVVQHNSSMLANEFIINSVVLPYHKSLYVSPSHDQSRQFSNGKLKPWIEDSPMIQKYFQDSSVSKQVFEKGFTNGSIGFLRSAFLNADRARGISADRFFLDEIQDILTSNIPVMEECLSHSKYGNKIFAGTPKTMENPIQAYWELSSQCEWLVPCEHHTPRHWNFLDERSIGLQGPICNKCGKAINPDIGQWVAFDSRRDIMGFRIAQLMVPWIYQHPNQWKKLLFKYETYSRTLFYNECLGISYDSASKPVTRMDLLACCTSQYQFRQTPDIFTKRVEVFGGVDWGEGTDGTDRSPKGKLKNASYTILTLGCYLDPTHFHFFYYRKFEGKEANPEICLPIIIETLRDFNVKCVGVDWGHGWGVNSRMEAALGMPRVVQFQHQGNQKERKKFDEIGVKYQLSRTEVMTDFFEDIKAVKIVWPAWESVSKYLVDIEHVYAEYSDYTKQMKFDHKVSEPDDCCHASIFCKEAADNYYGKVR